MTEDTRSPSVSRPFSDRSFGRLADALGPLLGLVVVIAFFALADYWQGNQKFFTVHNLHTRSVEAAATGVAALGMTAVIISGGIDLSAGTALALSATVLAYCLRENYPPAVAVLAGLGTGCLAGFVNGALISLLRVVPFIVTLGTMSVYLGVAKFVADETTIHLLREQAPRWLSGSGLMNTRPRPEWLADGWIPHLLPNFASGVWLALALAVLLSLVLKRTVFGRYIFAIGSNEATARLCGINVPLMKIAIYTLSGLFVGIGGLYQFSRTSVGTPTSGIGLELRIIAAVVLGGTSLKG